jgi:hypothetical protein
MLHDERISPQLQPIDGIEGRLFALPSLSAANGLPSTLEEVISPFSSEGDLLFDYLMWGMCVL